MVGVFSGCMALTIFFVKIFNGDLHFQSVIFTALSALSNTVLALVAYWQLPALEKTNKASQQTTKANFLLLLTEKWMHEDMIQARCLLHRQALCAKNKDQLQEIFSVYIVGLSQDPDKESIRDFARIISLLEFMETVSILCKEGHVTLEMLQQLFGGSLERYFYYLQGYILLRRQCGSPPGVTFKSDESLYRNYAQLIEELIEKS